MIFGKLICKFRPHKWRKARKDEPQDVKVCARCGVSSLVKKRAKPALKAVA